MNRTHEYIIKRYYYGSCERSHKRSLTVRCRVYSLTLFSSWLRRGTCTCDDDASTCSRILYAGASRASPRPHTSSLYLTLDAFHIRCSLLIRKFIRREEETRKKGKNDKKTNDATTSRFLLRGETHTTEAAYNFFDTVRRATHAIFCVTYTWGA